MVNLSSWPQGRQALASRIPSPVGISAMTSIVKAVQLMTSKVLGVNSTTMMVIDRNRLQNVGSERKIKLSLVFSYFPSIMCVVEDGMLRIDP